MAQGYHTLQEAAQLLAMSVDELRQMAQKNQVRSFQDRGTLRFRAQDIEELARQRGASSNLDLPLGESPPTPRTPRVSQLGPRPKDEGPDVFDFSLEVNDDLVDIGREILVADAKSSSRGSSSKKHSPRPVPGSDSDVRLIADGDLALNAQSDSDIRLVSPPHSKVKQNSSASRRKSSLAPPPTPVVKPKSQLAGPKSPGNPPKQGGAPSSGKLSKPSKLAPPTPVAQRRMPAPGSPLPQKKSALLNPMAGSDSGVRLVPLDSDSDVKIVGRSDEVNLGVAPPPGATDSDIRVEKFTNKPGPSEEAMLLTEEINLDEEIRKQEEALKQQRKPQAKLKRKSKLAGPSQTSESPFELSDHDLGDPGAQSSQEKPAVNPDSSDFDLMSVGTESDSSDFDLVPTGDGSVLLESNANDDFSLELPEDNALGGDVGVELKGPTSGINLADPTDEGISLEQGDVAESPDLDFEISLDAEGQPTPRPVQAVDEEASTSSEFEINLDESSDAPVAVQPPPDENGESEFELGVDQSSGEVGALQDSDNEFELTVDADSSSGELDAVSAEESEEMSSDSEFELTLDDGSVEETPAEDGEGKDIFETDFEVPGLEDESGSQVAALDTDEADDSSDFDIQVEDESGSQVVALDEEETGDAEETTAAPAKKKKGKSKIAAALEEGDESLEDFGGLDPGDEAPAPDEGEETVTSPAAAVAAGPGRVLRPAPWGVLPVIFMLPCVIVMVLVGLLGFELVQSANGYKPAGILTKSLAEMMQLKVK